MMTHGHYHFYTKDRSALINFLTSVFDAEITGEDDEWVQVKWGCIEAKIYHTTKGVKESSKRIAVHLILDGRETLEDLHQKLNFYCYREKLENVIIDKDENYISFVDTDARLWLLSI